MLPVPEREVQVLDVRVSKVCMYKDSDTRGFPI